MNEDLKILIKNTNFTKFYQLDSIHSECPWKKYEGLTPKEFIEINFSSIKNYTHIFQDLVAIHCLDIIFIETYCEKLQKKYWFCVYYFGKNEDNSLKYFVGGEPEYKVVFPETLKSKSNLIEYPDSLRAFWKIHGLFEVQLEYGSIDFNLSYLLENLSPEDGEGKVPHYTSLTLTGSEIYIDDWVAIADGYISIDDFNDTDFDDEDNFNSTYFVEEYLKKGIYFIQVNGDVVLLLKSYQGFPQFFYLCHDCSSNFYSSFWEYLTIDISLLSD